MRIIIKYPKNKHTKTLILLHGMNQDENDLEIITKNLENKKRGLKIIIPIADPIHVKWPDYTEEIINSWYNYYSRYDNKIKHDIINIPQFKKKSDEIKSIIEDECKYIDPSKYSYVVYHRRYYSYRRVFKIKS